MTAPTATAPLPLVTPVELADHVGETVQLRRWVYNCRQKGKLRCRLLRHGFRHLLDQPGIAKTQVDKAGARNLGRQADVVQFRIRDKLGCHLARRTPQLLAHGHGQVGLVIAEASILRGSDHLEQRLH